MPHPNPRLAIALLLALATLAGCALGLPGQPTVLIPTGQGRAVQLQATELLLHSDRGGERDAQGRWVERWAIASNLGQRLSGEQAEGGPWRWSLNGASASAAEALAWLRAMPAGGEAIARKAELLRLLEGLATVSQPEAGATAGG